MKGTDTLNIVTDTIQKVNDSTIVVACPHAVESHTLSGYMTDSCMTLCVNPTFAHQDLNVVAHLGFTSGVIGIIAIVLLLSVFICVPKITPKIIKDWISKKSLKWPFLIVWLYGFIVYDVGMCTGEHVSLFTNAPMAIIYAFKIFIFESDVSEIHSQFHESWVYSLNFALVHFLAAIISTTFIIKHFGFNIIARFKMWSYSILRCLRKLDVAYVVWGFNDASYLLAKSINDYYATENSKRKATKKRKIRYQIFIVRTDNDGDTPYEERPIFDRVLKRLSLKTPEIEKIKELDCLIVGSHVNLRGINVKQSEGSITDILSQLRLNTLRRVIEHGIKGKVLFLFLSDNETENIHAVALLANDASILNLANKNAHQEGKEAQFSVTFHCHARYNSIHRVIEDNMTRPGLQIRVIDSSHLSVELLKQDKDHIPANFVNVEPDGRVSSAFNSLVVGFSEVGQDSVRFIYEYGAFVGADSSAEKSQRSAFHMDVVDCKMKNLAGAFRADAPAINPGLCFDDENTNSESPITLYNMDCNSTDFYDMVINKIATLNYIVIATNDDELNISLGIRIYELAMRYRADFKNFCILVRVHSDEDGHFRKITQYYNRLFAALGDDFDTSRATQSKIKRDAKRNLPLYIFGLDKEVYTYENIIDDVIEQEAAKFKEEYNVATGDKDEVSTDPKTMAWYKAYEELMQLDSDHVNFSPTYCGIMKLRRTRGQDVANYLHKSTKELIKDKAIKAAQNAGLSDDISWNLYSRIPKQIKYMKDGRYVDDYATNLLNVLAQMEHLRWNASHEIYGYTRGGNIKDKDEVKRTHSCLRAYHEFDTENPLHVEALSYDNSVVDLTLGVVRANINTNKANK